MKHEKKCPKCNGSNIIDAQTVDYVTGIIGRPATVATYKRPEGMLFRGRREVEVHAFVCTNCGYIEYYAKNPKALLDPEADTPPNTP